MNYKSTMIGYLLTSIVVTSIAIFYAVFQGSTGRTSWTMSAAFIVTLFLPAILAIFHACKINLVFAQIEHIATKARYRAQCEVHRLLVRDQAQGTTNEVLKRIQPVPIIVMKKKRKKEKEHEVDEKTQLTKEEFELARVRAETIDTTVHELDLSISLLDTLRELTRQDPITVFGVPITLLFLVGVVTLVTSSVTTFLQRFYFS